MHKTNQEREKSCYSWKITWFFGRIRVAQVIRRGKIGFAAGDLNFPRENLICHGGSQFAAVRTQFSLGKNDLPWCEPNFPWEKTICRGANPIFLGKKRFAAVQTRFAAGDLDLSREKSICRGANPFCHGKNQFAVVRTHFVTGKLDLSREKSFCKEKCSTFSYSIVNATPRPPVIAKKS